MVLTPHRRQRGEALTLVLVIVGLAAATQLVPNWRLSNLFKAPPPTKELQAAEAAAAQARADAAKARAALDQVEAAAQARQREQVAYAQQMVAGVPAALKDEPQTAGVVLATNLAERASLGLASAIGDLPRAKQAEILQIVQQALSGKQAEIEDARRQLAAKDAELKVVTKERIALEAKLPVIIRAKEEAEAKVETTAASAAEKAAEVAKMAEQLFNEKRAAGTLGASVRKLGYAVIILAVLAVIGFVAWSWAQAGLKRAAEFPKAVAHGIADMREKGLLPPKEEANPFDPYLNRNEQAEIAKYIPPAK